jgi:hypothetical protein
VAATTGGVKRRPMSRPITAWATSRPRGTGCSGTPASAAMAQAIIGPRIHASGTRR